MFLIEYSPPPNVWEIVKKLNPSFKPFKRPIKYNLFNFILHACDDNTFYEFGDDISEPPERKKTDKRNEPIFLIKFPTHIKSFYMKRDPMGVQVTESIDFLLSRVGEIIGDL
ncbi:hypothetical protein HZS_3463 [Henneguya salminicola]|nr:hypothetical protein HZS_3463 [Henneguya salminicola]